MFISTCTIISTGKLWWIRGLVSKVVVDYREFTVLLYLAIVMCLLYAYDDRIILFYAGIGTVHGVLTVFYCTMCGRVSHIAGGCRCQFVYNLSLTGLSSCTAGVDICKTLDSDDYSALLWTSVAEVPGIFFTTFLLVMPCLGRKMVMASGMAILTIFTGLLLICADRCVGFGCVCPGTHVVMLPEYLVDTQITYTYLNALYCTYYVIDVVSGVSCVLLYSSLYRIVLTIILFVCRGIMGGVFQAMFVYTPEVYSTTVRGLGLGMSSTFGRIGGVLVPYVALVCVCTHKICTYL